MTIKSNGVICAFFIFIGTSTAARAESFICKIERTDVIDKEHTETYPTKMIEVGREFNVDHLGDTDVGSIEDNGGIGVEVTDAEYLIKGYLILNKKNTGKWTPFITINRKTGEYHLSGSDFEIVSEDSDADNPENYRVRRDFEQYGHCRTRVEAK